jgi:C-terminal processing protease CtpA/Prc
MENEKDIVYSQSVKAGKRIYYLDVKRNKRDELFLSITESKKLVSGEGAEATFSFEKHKIFLYKEDYAKFQNALNGVIEFIETGVEPVFEDESALNAVEDEFNAEIENIKFD